MLFRSSLKIEDQSKLDQALEKLVKRVAKGSLIALFGQAFGKVLGFILQVILGRFLGPGAYGLYALGVNTVNLTGQLSMLGFSNGLIRFVAHYREKGDTGRLKGVLFLSLVLSGVAATVIAFILLLLSDPISVGIFGEPELSGVLQAISIALPFYVLMTLTQSGIRGFERIDHFVTVGVFRSAANVFVVLIIFFLGFRLHGAVLAFVLSTFLSLMLAIYYMRRDFPEFISASQPRFEVRRMLRYSMPLYLAGFSFLLTARIDLFMIGYYLPSADVGVYRSAVVLADFVSFPLVALNVAFAPMISYLYSRGSLNELSRLYQIGTRWITAGGLLIASLLILFSQELLGLWGPEFKAGWPALVVLALAQLINTATGSVGFLLQMTERQDYVLVNNVTTMVLNIVLNLWLIPLYGILGAALATGISLIANNLLGLLEAYLMLKIHPWNRSYFRIAIPLVTAITGYWIAINLQVSPILSVLVVASTFTIAFLVSSLTEADKMILRTIVGKIYRRRG